MSEEYVNVEIADFTMEEAIAEGTAIFVELTKTSKNPIEMAFIISTIVAEMELAGYIVSEEEKEKTKKLILKHLGKIKMRE